VVDCWGGRVVKSKEELTPNQPVAPIDYTKDLSCPFLGLFGNEDKAPTPEQVDQHEAELKKHGNVSYDHPYDLPLEHALNIDFVNEALGPGARVAVELSVDAARQLVKTIEAVLAQADQRDVLQGVPVAARPARDPAVV
jgi:dienelactone hydrolase